MRVQLQFTGVEQTMPMGMRSPIDPDEAWQRVLRRDPNVDFFYGVVTTGVFCRPNCSSRRPLRENVRFFATMEAARRAGLRPCLKCKPESDAAAPLQKMRAHLEAHFDRAVPLKELGRIAGLSLFTAQRLFKREMGVSPLEYQRGLRATRLRSSLKQGGTVTDAVYEAGFGSSSRVYEGANLGMTPGRFAEGGKGEKIGFTSAQTPFGWMVVGATERGLCWLALAGNKAEAEASLRDEFPLAELKRDASLSELVSAALASVREGDDLAQSRSHVDALDLRGTVFQLRVWQALRNIPRGETRTYSQLASEMGIPKSTRAVARACAVNRVALVVPCHRVIGVSGALTGYRWGVDRKRQLLEAEKS